MVPGHACGQGEIIAGRLAPVLSSDEEVEALAHAVRRRGTPIEAHLKIDTGMSRLGVPVMRTGEIALACARGGIRVVGLMTHFACADSDDPADPESMTRK